MAEFIPFLHPEPAMEIQRRAFLGTVGVGALAADVEPTQFFVRLTRDLVKLI